LNEAIKLAEDRTFDFLINFPEHPSREPIEYYKLRRKAADYALPVISNERVATMLAQALCKHKSPSELDIQPYDYYHSLCKFYCLLTCFCVGFSCCFLLD
jgi:hypothetical protein